MKIRIANMISMELLDGAACVLLAAAAAVRAKACGAHFTGSLVLGCLCGLVGPLLREAFLHGAPATGAVVRELPGEALAGAVGGMLVLYLLNRAPDLRGRLFAWLDGSSIGMATSVGTILAIQELGLVGALTIGMINGLAPGLARDVSLGDTALLVEKSWYATAAALGSMAAMALFVFLSAGYVNNWFAQNAASASALFGFFTIICIRAWRTGRGDIE